MESFAGFCRGLGCINCGIPTSMIRGVAPESSRVRSCDDRVMLVAVHYFVNLCKVGDLLCISPYIKQKKRNERNEKKSIQAAAPKSIK